MPKDPASIENRRAALASGERSVRIALSDLLRRPRTHREGLHQSHRVRRSALALHSAAIDARALSAEVAADVAAMREEVASGGPSAVFTAFYDTLREIRARHAGAGDTIPVVEPLPPASEQVDAMIESQRLAARARAEGTDPDSLAAGSSHLAPAFSGEEGYGRYLDLQECYAAFTNVPLREPGPPPPYLSYVSSLADFDLFRPEHRSSGARVLRTYLETLEAYLVSFHTRIAPLTDVEAMLKDADAKDGGNGGGKAEDGAVWCDVCERGFSSEAMFERHLPGKKHAKAAARKEKNNAGNNNNNNNNNGNGAAAIRRLECRIRALCSALEDQIEATKAHVEAKQTRTLGEIEHDMEAAALGEDLGGADAVDTDSEDEGKPLYNPLNLPMGHDGKPIPFWLYKLQGLGQKYVCEVCGNHEYRGPRAYEKHFQEARHNHGMRCLGVPNTLHFHGLTKIDEVLSVYAKHKKDLDRESWRPEAEEEFEDAEGNVLTRKVRDDLARQGLL